MSADSQKLNAEQLQAVTFGEGPLLIIAGAGTGKTTVITQRITHLLSSGKAKPTEILALTFTEKASREMEERVDRALPYGITQLWISTFHAFCDRILKSEGIHIGINPGYKLLGEAEAIQFFRSHLFSFDLSYFRPLGNPNKFIAGMLVHFSRLKDEDILPTQYQQWVKEHYQDIKQVSDEKKLEGEKYRELAVAYEQYEALKLKEGFFDYADLISNTLQVFRKRPNRLKAYQDQFKYILIDEFQDTNYAQNELAVLIAGKKQNITVVGDDDQSIYRWRGAAIANIIQFRKRFPNTTVVVLTKNYRSTKEILDRSYDLITKNNPDRLEVVENIEKKLESSRRTHGEKVTVLVADRVENEAEAVVREIEKRKSTSAAALRWKDFAILVRANAHAEPFIRELSRKGIPFQFLGPGQLFRQAEVKDLIAYLKLLANYDDSVAAYRVFSLDIFGVPARDVASVMGYSKKYGLSFLESAEIFVGKRQAAAASSIPVVSDEGQKAILSVVTLIHRHLALVKKDTAGQILYYFLQDTGLLKQFTSYKTVSEERHAANIAKFFDKLKSYEVDHEDASVFTVVEWIDLAMTLGESPLAANNDWSETDAVNILTIHSAKGLEFPVVFLVNLVSARFPTVEKKEQIPLPEGVIKELLPSGDYHLQEERRLFYVGMTRARDVLCLTAAKYYGEGKREKKLSPFIAEAVGEDTTITQVHTENSAGQLSLLSWEKHTQPEQKVIKQTVSYLSYSQLASFETCPLQYRYRYILKIPVAPSAALSFGDTIHKTLQGFYEKVKAGQSVTKETLLELFEKTWQAVGFGNKIYEKTMKEKGKKVLTDYYENGFDPAVIPLSLEESFKITITSELKVGGKIDRVDALPDGRIEVIDYKTGTAPKTRDVTNDDQLTLYALAATQKGMYNKKPDEVIVSFYFLEDQQKVTATRTAQQLESLKETITKKADEIRRSDFRPTPGKHCDFCEFRLICEAWS